MIHCIRFADVAAYLARLGFAHLGVAGEAHVFEHPNRPGELPPFCSIHMPNHRGMVTELSVNDSFYAAEIPVPDFDLEWCD
ncbi:hypothetical protein [Methylobacterium indicum]|uniref:Uncharacterized protein n=1 Tax=Methylobacterium indicum TaxID=1775910 RepID=A0A8H8WNS5_9HYPH|nr:hypothetical protein [Methylobacterium indicum]BCM81581.1 hypothetical protein mvi_00420 [Methylobacterium indicum]